MVFILSEGIGSIPRPESLIRAMKSGDVEAIKSEQDKALADTIQKLSGILGGKYPITDGEQVYGFLCFHPSCYVVT
jgi:hypothetical protein